MQKHCLKTTAFNAKISYLPNLRDCLLEYDYHLWKCVFKYSMLYAYRFEKKIFRLVVERNVPLGLLVQY